MPDSSRPFLALYVVWHPAFVGGAAIEKSLREHFRSKLYDNVAGGTGLSVLSRSAVPAGAATPIPIDLDGSETTAIVALLDANWAADEEWKGYLRHLAEQTDRVGLGARLFPVSIDRSALDVGVAEEAIRWDQWDEEDEEARHGRLVGDITYAFCRMLRHYLAHLENPAKGNEELERYLQNVKIFLSHSKHDDYGERVAMAIRDKLHAAQGLASFFDVRDIPAGMRFHTVLVHEARVSAMLAIHTDSYSSREWCRRELIEAKRHDVPLVVANCLTDWDERGFPYMGNVPIVRMAPTDDDRIDAVVHRLLDEVLKDFLWRCRVLLAKRTVGAEATFVPRQPELVMLGRIPPEADVAHPILVYPDPPLSAEEERLFEEIMPRLQLRSMFEWLAGAIR